MIMYSLSNSLRILYVILIIIILLKGIIVVESKHATNTTNCEDWLTYNHGFVRSYQPYTPKDNNIIQFKNQKLYHNEQFITQFNKKTTYVFIHLSKSAGTTIKNAFRNRIDFILFRRSWSTFKELSMKYGPKYWEGKVIVGTNSFGACEYAKHGNGCVYFTSIRDPVDRIISMYNYFCIDGNEGHKHWQPDWTSCKYSLLDYAKINYNFLNSEIGINQDPRINLRSIDNYKNFPYNYQEEFVIDINNKTIHRCNYWKGFSEGIFHPIDHMNASIMNMMNYIIVLPIHYISQFLCYYQLSHLFHPIKENKNVNNQPSLNHIHNIDDKLRSSLENILYADMFVYDKVMENAVNIMNTNEYRQQINNCLLLNT